MLALRSSAVSIAMSRSRSTCRRRTAATQTALLVEAVMALARSFPKGLMSFAFILPAVVGRALHSKRGCISLGVWGFGKATGKLPHPKHVHGRQLDEHDQGMVSLEEVWLCRYTPAKNCVGCACTSDQHVHLDFSWPCQCEYVRQIEHQDQAVLSVIGPREELFLPPLLQHCVQSGGFLGFRLPLPS